MTMLLLELMTRRRWERKDMVSHLVVGKVRVVGVVGLVMVVRLVAMLTMQARRGWDPRR